MIIIQPSMIPLKQFGPVLFFSLFTVVKTSEKVLYQDSAVFKKKMSLGLVGLKTWRGRCDMGMGASVRNWEQEVVHPPLCTRNPEGHLQEQLLVDVLCAREGGSAATSSKLLLAVATHRFPLWDTRRQELWRVPLHNCGWGFLYFSERQPLADVTGSWA